MENQNDVQPGQTQSPSPTPPPVPSIDLKSPLKIETSAQKMDPDEPQGNYGQKLFLFGMIFCGVMIATVVIISLFWMQTSNAPQKIITIEAKK